MASSSTSKITFTALDGTAIERPIEWTRARVMLAIDPNALEEFTLLINGEQLELTIRVIDRRKRVTADWPRANAGLYELTLSRDGHPTPEEEFRCRIEPAKLTQAEIEWLLDDVQTRLPASLAFALSHRGAFADIELVPEDESSLEQELAHLRRAIDGAPGHAGVRSLLEAIAVQPHQGLEAEQPWTPLDRARSFGGPALAAAARRPGNVTRNAGRPSYVRDRRATHSTDTAENQLVLHYLDELATRLRMLAHKRHGDRVVAQATELAGRLRGARQDATFLDGVNVPETPPTVDGSAVMLHRDDYRAVAKGLRDLNRRALLRLGVTARPVSALDQLPDLYEGWLTLHVMLAILELGTEHGFERTKCELTRRYGRTFLVRVLPGGNTPLVTLHRQEDGVVLEAFAQRVYMPADDPPKDLHSVSFQQKPDVAIEIRHGDSVDVVIFDAKYKLRDADRDDRPVKDDIDAMHAYRDAIRNADGERAVTYAGILYPGSAFQYGGGLEAIRARPDDDGRLRQKLREVLGPRLTRLGDPQPAA